MATVPDIAQRFRERVTFTTSNLEHATELSRLVERSLVFDTFVDDLFLIVDDLTLFLYGTDLCALITHRIDQPFARTGAFDTVGAVPRRVSALHGVLDVAVTRAFARPRRLADNTDKHVSVMLRSAYSGVAVAPTDNTKLRHELRKYGRRIGFSLCLDSLHEVAGNAV